MNVFIDPASATHDLPTPHFAGFVSHPSGLIAKVYGQTDVDYANSARLIAVAPDMLAALRAIAEVGIHEIGDFQALAARMQKQAKDAIAKAEGK